MPLLRRFVRRLAALFRHDRSETELAREIGAHLQLIEDKYRAQGMSDAEARHAARREFGGVEQAKERQRDARTFRPLAGASTDLKLGVRMLSKSPGVTIVGVIALAVAVGGGAAYFEFVNDFFRPRMSFPGGDRLVGLINVDIRKNDLETRLAWDFARWRRTLRSVEDIGAARGGPSESLMTADGRADAARAAEVSASAFRVVPGAPVLGRPLIEADEQPGAPAVVVIGHDLWRDRFNSAADVIGQTVRLGDTTHTIVGVMPPGFAFPMNHNLWTPLRLEISGANGLTRSEGPSLRVFGRLAQGVSLSRAQAELETIASNAPDAAAFTHLRPQVRRYVDAFAASADIRWQVRVLYGVNVIFIGLLAVCGMNVATLVFARTATREAEITVRTALGASRARIVGQLVAEALVLATVAAVLGLSVASRLIAWAGGILVQTEGEPMPFWWDEQLGVETILYAVVLVIVAALVVGGIPALKATGPRMQGRLKQAGAGGSTLRFGKLWTGVIVGQVAITVLMLLSVVVVGWDAVRQHQKFADVTFPRGQYLTALLAIDETVQPRAAAVMQELMRRLAQEPSVVNASWSSRVPGLGGGEFWVELPAPAMQAEAEARSNDDVLWVRSAWIGANYFETMNQPLVLGRRFTATEIAAGRDVAIVDESFVRLVLGGRPAVGQLVRQRISNAPSGPWLEIVGVVRDIAATPTSKTNQSMIYRPFAPGTPPAHRVVIHARTDPGQVGTPIRLAALAADPRLRFFEIHTVERSAEIEIQEQGFFVKAMGAVGLVTLLLATAGIYAMIAFTLSRRTREIGIRTALGASRFRVMRGVLARAVIQVGAGVLLGGIPGAILVRTTGGTSLGAATITAAVAAIILSVAVVACIVPVRRALRVQPTEALRIDA